MDQILIIAICAVIQIKEISRITNVFVKLDSMTYPITRVVENAIIHGF